MPEENPKPLSSYLGDGVYAEWNGYGISLDLRAQPQCNIRDDKNVIVLDPEVISKLLAWLWTLPGYQAWMRERVPKEHRSGQ